MYITRRMQLQLLNQTQLAEIGKLIRILAFSAPEKIFQRVSPLLVTDEITLMLVRQALTRNALARQVENYRVEYLWS